MFPLLYAICTVVRWWQHGIITSVIDTSTLPLMIFSRCSFSLFSRNSLTWEFLVSFSASTKYENASGPFLGRILRTSCSMVVWIVFFFFRRSISSLVKMRFSKSLSSTSKGLKLSLSQLRFSCSTVLWISSIFLQQTTMPAVTSVFISVLQIYAYTVKLICILNFILHKSAVCTFEEWDKNDISSPGHWHGERYQQAAL